MRGVFLICCLGLLAGLSGVACGGDDPARAEADGNFSLEQARAFGEFPLYAPGESYGELPLTSVGRTFDDSPDATPVRANFVDFVYGTCDPPQGEGGCAPPLSVQVWAACERNPMVYSPVAGLEPPIEIRGAPGYFYEGGRRLELSTGASTVVIFASGRADALAAADALVGINNPVTRGENLPTPDYTRSEGGIVSVVPCAYEDPKQQIGQDPAKAKQIGRALERELDAGAARHDNPPVRTVECFRSPVPTRAGELADAHECMISWNDGSFVTWCVLSGETELLRATLPKSCEESASAGESFIPAVGPAAGHELAWGGHASEACGPWREGEMQAMAELDQELVVEDLSYMWFVMRPFEAGIVRDLRVIPGRAGGAKKAVALYQKRLAAIDAGLDAWNEGRKARALELFSRAEATKVQLSDSLARLHADACAPP
jgi:hypothetical protein